MRKDSIASEPFAFLFVLILEQTINRFVLKGEGL